jgi:hypothetical protein
LVIISYVSYLFLELRGTSWIVESEFPPPM